MKKVLIGWALAVAGVLTAFTGLLWVNNIVSAVKSYERLFSADVTVSLNEQMSGFIPSLDWSTLDLSTISTFIPFLGLLYVMAGLMRLLKQGKAVLSIENFPFFASYDRINISLGLIGTIWGIIIIGFYRAEEINVSSLMMCLHTALFSTLIAVVWVSILIPAFIMPMFRVLAGVKSGNGGVIEEDENIFELVEKLSVAAAATSKEFAASNEQLHTFNGRLRNAAEEINECSHNLSGMLHQMTNAGELWQQEQARQVEVLNQTAKMVESVSNIQAQLSAQMEKLQRDNATLQAQNSALRTTNNELSESANAAGVENVRLKTALEQIKGALH